MSQPHCRTWLLAIVLACVPSADEPNKVLAAAKVVGASATIIALGAGVYWRGARSIQTERE